MKNNLSPSVGYFERANVIYQFNCPLSHGQATEYIGFTQNTLSQRLTYHRQNGGICDHFSKFHGIKPTRDQLLENTKIIGGANNRQKLLIKEAIIILERKPVINR